MGPVPRRSAVESLSASLLSGAPPELNVACRAESGAHPCRFSGRPAWEQLSSDTNRAPSPCAACGRPSLKSTWTRLGLEAWCVCVFVPEHWETDGETFPRLCSHPEHWLRGVSWVLPEKWREGVSKKQNQLNLHTPSMYVAMRRQCAHACFTVCAQGGRTGGDRKLCPVVGRRLRKGWGHSLLRGRGGNV